MTFWEQAPRQHGLLSSLLVPGVQRRRRQMGRGQQRGGRQVEDSQRPRSVSFSALFFRQLRAEKIPLAVLIFREVM